jgi:hypothetical protein
MSCDVPRENNINISAAVPLLKATEAIVVVAVIVV